MKLRPTNNPTTISPFRDDDDDDALCKCVCLSPQYNHIVAAKWKIPMRQKFLLYTNPHERN